MRCSFFLMENSFHTESHSLFQIMNGKICFFIFYNSLKKSLSSSQDHKSHIAHITDAVNGSFQDGVDQLKDGKIDAAFVVAGAPTPAVQDLSTGKQVYLVSLDKDHIDSLIASNPYYKEYTISKEVYNTPEDVTTVAVAAVVIARNDVSEAAIYNFVSAIFNNINDIGHAKKAELSLDFASSITNVPYHPGAAKYFAEKDITVKTA